jgi:phage-related protein
VELARWEAPFCIAASKLVLLHGIVKKARTTPKADLELARKRLREMVSR